MNETIPVNEPLFGGNEKKYLNQCIDTGWISSEGPFVRQFEKDFANRVDRKFGIAVTNGSAALETAMVALGLEPSDEVIMPTFTIISCASAIIRAGAKPILVDSDPETWNMCSDQVATRVNGRTRAIMVVHIYGLPVDMDPIIALAKKHNLMIIEDAAEMHGGSYQGRPCGGFGDISIFSFYPNKHVTTGEGGMILTNDEKLAERCRNYSNLCFQPKRRFVHHELGWNYRMSNLQAAVGVAQLERLDEFIRRKKRMGKIYSHMLADLPQIQLPLESSGGNENIYWVFGLVIRDNVGLDAAEIMRRLAERKIQTRPFFWPMHEQPVFRKMGLFDGESYPVAEKLARQGFYIPSGLALTEEQIVRVAGAVREVLQ